MSRKKKTEKIFGFWETGVAVGLLFLIGVAGYYTGWVVGGMVVEGLR